MGVSSLSVDNNGAASGEDHRQRPASGRASVPIHRALELQKWINTPKPGASGLLVVPASSRPSV